MFTLHLPTSRRARELGGTVGAWCLVAGVASVLRVITTTLTRRPTTFSSAATDIPIIALWALATPFVLRSARRFPIHGARAARHAIVHVAIGTTFIVVTNVAIRLPLLADGLVVLLRDTALGLAAHYPAAIVSYAVLVALGYRLFATAEEPAPPVASPSVVDAERLVIREWNRVHFVALDDIEWIEAANNHVVVHTVARTYKGRERISDVEARLDARRFIRVHRSALVHIAKVREVQPLMRGDQAIVLRSGTVVRVARSRKLVVSEALGVSL
jgi:hypothetical protein